MKMQPPIGTRHHWNLIDHDHCTIENLLRSSLTDSYFTNLLETPHAFPHPHPIYSIICSSCCFMAAFGRFSVWPDARLKSSMSDSNRNRKYFSMITHVVVDRRPEQRQWEGNCIARCSLHYWRIWCRRRIRQFSSNTQTGLRHALLSTWWCMIHLLDISFTHLSFIGGNMHP